MELMKADSSSCIPKISFTNISITKYGQGVVINVRKALGSADNLRNDQVVEFQPI